MIKYSSLLQFIDQCPPFLVAGIARMDGKPRKGASMKYISGKSGIAHRTVVRILAKTSWAGVKLSMADRILQACNIDLWRMGRYRIYVKKTNQASHPFRHMHHKQRAAMFRRMMEFARKQAELKQQSQN